MAIGVFDISVVELCLVGLLVLAFIYELYFYVRYMRIRQKNATSQTASNDTKPAQTAPGVSVLVCARNEAINLESYVQSLLTQDYPTFEVIFEFSCSSFLISSPDNLSNFRRK